MEGAIKMYNEVPDATMNEIVAGANGTVENKADTAIAFLEDYSKWLVELIEIFKAFFERISEAFKSEQ